MKTEKLTFRVKATVSKIIEVDVPVNGESMPEVIERGRQMAHDYFSILNDGNEEKYTEESYLIPNHVL